MPDPQQTRVITINGERHRIPADATPAEEEAIVNQLDVESRGSAPWRFASEFANNAGLNPKDLLHGAQTLLKYNPLDPQGMINIVNQGKWLGEGLVKDPKGTVAQTPAAPVLRLGNVPKMLREGRYRDAADETAASIPIIGPMAERASQQSLQGDWAGAVGGGLGMVAAPFMPGVEGEVIARGVQAAKSIPALKVFGRGSAAGAATMDAAQAERYRQRLKVFEAQEKAKGAKAAQGQARNVAKNTAAAEIQTERLADHGDRLGARQTRSEQGAARRSAQAENAQAGHAQAVQDFDAIEAARQAEIAQGVERRTVAARAGEEGFGQQMEDFTAGESAKQAQALQDQQRRVAQAGAQDTGHAQRVADFEAQESAKLARERQIAQEQTDQLRQTEQARFRQEMADAIEQQRQQELLQNMSADVPVVQDNPLAAFNSLPRGLTTATEVPASAFSLPPGFQDAPATTQHLRPNALMQQATRLAEARAAAQAAGWLEPPVTPSPFTEPLPVQPRVTVPGARPVPPAPIPTDLDVLTPGARPVPPAPIPTDPDVFVPGRRPSPPPYIPTDADVVVPGPRPVRNLPLPTDLDVVVPGRPPDVPLPTLPTQTGVPFPSSFTPGALTGWMLKTGWDKFFDK